ncbi:uncharacterized protein LOC121998491 isoform X1 [Zingiber officinale]|uniref:Ribosomal protein L34Ae n=1 Tax=Zingiber officinale TaxID=94328 RepID=A0A8J5G7F0_ZINOF|nr:uncharacterized protein LOC121998491 isoform X1 [Zingiber officinale]KAG6502080.1 hypothetical protein ZIOFF_041967 [Zingiber officinale]
MEFLKARRFSIPRFGKLTGREDPDHECDRSSESKEETLDAMPKLTSAAGPAWDGDEGEDDDDFITNEVKRRLEQLRKNSFLVLIPEEECPEEEEEEEESSSSGWRESDMGDAYPNYGFDKMHDEYTQRMLFFDKCITEHLKEAESLGMPNQSRRPTSKEIALGLRNISLKRQDEHRKECEYLQQLDQDDPCQNLEAAYVAQVSLSWEALHCQYLQLNQRILMQSEHFGSYGYAAQAFQQFQVLLQRFVENEPFDQGSRVDIYANSRSLQSKFLQVPNFLGLEKKENVDDYLDEPVLATELIKIIGDSILTFLHFLNIDKKKTSSFFWAHSPRGSLQQVRASLEKKEMKVKELFKRKGAWKKKAWPSSKEQVELLFALIDIKVISRVLRMVHLSKEQLLWCEEKMSKLVLSDNKLCRDVSPLLFPC